MQFTLQLAREEGSKGSSLARRVQPWSQSRRSDPLAGGERAASGGLLAEMMNEHTLRWEGEI